MVRKNNSKDPSKIRGEMTIGLKSTENRSILKRVAILIFEEEVAVSSRN